MLYVDSAEQFFVAERKTGIFACMLNIVSPIAWIPLAFPALSVNFVSLCFFAVLLLAKGYVLARMRSIIPNCATATEFVRIRNPGMHRYVILGSLFINIAVGTMMLMYLGLMIQKHTDINLLSIVAFIIALALVVALRHGLMFSKRSHMLELLTIAVFILLTVPVSQLSFQLLSGHDTLYTLQAANIPIYIVAMVAIVFFEQSSVQQALSTKDTKIKKAFGLATIAFISIFVFLSFFAESIPLWLFMALSLAISVRALTNILCSFGAIVSIDVYEAYIAEKPTDKDLLNAGRSGVIVGAVTLLLTIFLFRFLILE